MVSRARLSSSSMLASLVVAGEISGSSAAASPSSFVFSSVSTEAGGSLGPRLPFLFRSGISIEFAALHTQQKV